MKLSFRLRFHTGPGQSIALSAPLPGTGAGGLLPMRPLEDGFWLLTIDVAPGSLPEGGLDYHYVLRHADGTQEWDGGNDRLTDTMCAGRSELLLADTWNFAGYAENAYYTEPFRKVLLQSNVPARFPAAAAPGATHRFKARAPLLRRNETLCLLGDRPALGSWNTAAPLLMSRIEGGDWFGADVDLSGNTFPVSYKYGVFDLENNRFREYETGDNRVLIDWISPGKLTAVNDVFARIPAAPWRGAGVAVPVFSLRSREGFGVGEFTDIPRLVDWCVRTGLKLIQLLPVNDTTSSHDWQDSYPYNAISVFALHPVYLNLSEALGPVAPRLLPKFEAERQRLNALDVLDYEAVMKAKLAILKQAFTESGAEVFESEDYQEFFRLNGEWLVPYAVFSHLRDKHGTPDFERWPKTTRCTPELLKRLTGPRSAARRDIEFHYFVQYHLHRQLRAASRYAHDHGVILKGDIAIGVNRHGADAWQDPGAYRMEMQAGAPPDDFAVKGQNWGFPTYNWDVMQKDGFGWWKRRFEQMSRYFDAFRIDHILGFFRIWSVPVDAVEGILGYFVPALPVMAEDFIRRGIPFNRDRFVEPHITTGVLTQIFGSDSESVQARYLDATGPGRFRLKPAFATQRAVESHFKSLEDSAANRRIREGLYDLVSNVILFEVEGPRGPEYHFRFGMEGTSSFRDLDAESRAGLPGLYEDYFFRRQDAFWRKAGLEKLPALKRVTDMLVCGEDLGMVPACVPDVMRQLGLLSLEVQRMPKALGAEFFNPARAPYLSVVTPSTHDMSTIRGWWEEDPKRTQRFFNEELGRPGPAPFFCEAWINRAILEQHLRSPAMWSVFQLQDVFGMDDAIRREKPQDERINVPANPRHYWRYRMHLDLETLLRADAFNSELQAMVRQAGR
ncbi:MAG: 4-alpha-glucanotransferase [Verrucomicrobiota bacterium]